MSDTFRVRVRLKSFKQVVPIEGGRFLRADPVRADLLNAAEAAAFDLEFLSGFALVCWDDEKVTVAEYGNADHSPVRNYEIPKFAKRALRSLIEGGPGDADAGETDDNEG